MRWVVLIPSRYFFCLQIVVPLHYSCSHPSSIIIILVQERCTKGHSSLRFSCGRWIIVTWILDGVGLETTSPKEYVRLATYLTLNMILWKETIYWLMYIELVHIVDNARHWGPALAIMSLKRCPNFLYITYVLYLQLWTSSAYLYAQNRYFMMELNLVYDGTELSQATDCKWIIWEEENWKI